MAKVLVIDADSAVYACGFMAQQKTHYVTHGATIVKTDRDKRVINKWLKTQTEFEPDELELDYSMEVEPIENCLHGVKQWIHNIMEYSTCDRYIVLLTKGGSCFRTRLARIVRYKGNRMDTAKPYHYDNIRNYMTVHHGAKTYAKWEADDTAVMIMANDHPDHEYILAAIDKDLDQIPGKRVNPNKRGQKKKDTDGNEYNEEDWGVYVQDELECWRCFYTQMLMGDKADNIKGLSGTRGKPGIGETKAKKLLADCTTPEEMCQVVAEQYRKKYGDEPFELVPWWWDDDWVDEKKYPADVVAQTKEYRKCHPLYGKVKSFTVTWVDMFRENADLLYMLRNKTDQYVPHFDIEGDEYHWPDYEGGIIAHVFESN